MTFSRWRAAGNEYLLAERADLGASLTPERVQAEVGGSDGILEVVAVSGREAEIVIWNPDGSTAELSGNGTRIVARWLADRSGSDEVAVRVGDRTVAARVLPDGEIEQHVGTVEVYERERVAGLQVIAVSVGNPHAVVVGDPNDLPPGNGLLLWFEVDDFDAATARAEAMGAEVIMPRHRNPPDGDGGPNHWEVWLRDLDGYKVVLASPDGTADGVWRPRPTEDE